MDAFLSQVDILPRGVEVAVAFSPALVADLDVSLWENVDVRWDDRKGDWVPDETGALQHRVKSLQMEAEGPELLNGEVKVRVLSITGARGLRLPLAAASLLGR